VAVDEESATYLEVHQTRLEKTLGLIPPGGPEDRILEMGAYMQMTPALHDKLGYGEVRGCYYGEPGRVDHRSVTSSSGETFTCEIDHFDAEKDPFPYPDEHFLDRAVLRADRAPVHGPHAPDGRSEPHPQTGRPLRADHAEHRQPARPGGHLQGYHPGFFHAYLRPSETGEGDARTIANTRRARFTSCW